MRALAALVGPSLRLVPWLTLLAGAAVGAALLAPLARSGAEPAAVLTGLRVAAAALASGAAFVLDDETEDGLAGTPTSLVARRALRIVLGLPVLAACWWGLVALAGSSPLLPEEVPLPSDGLTLEAVALLAVSLCATALARPWTGSRSGALAAPAVLGGLLLVAHLLPARWALIAHPGATEQWRDAHVRWAALGGSALVGLLWCSRDRGRRSPLRVVRRLRPRARPLRASPTPSPTDRVKEQV